MTTKSEVTPRFHPPNPRTIPLGPSDSRRIDRSEELTRSTNLVQSPGKQEATPAKLRTARDLALERLARQESDRTNTRKADKSRQEDRER